MKLKLSLCQLNVIRYAWPLVKISALIPWFFFFNTSPKLSSFHVPFLLQHLHTLLNVWIWPIGDGSCCYDFYGSANQWVIIKLKNAWVEQSEQNRYWKYSSELTAAPLKAEVGTLSARLRTLDIIYEKLKVFFLPLGGPSIFFY